MNQTMLISSSILDTRCINQMSRRSPKSADRVASTEGIVNCGPSDGCEAGGDAFPPPPAGGERVNGLTAVGRGGSTTSDTLSTGNGASAGGCTRVVMSCNKPPTWTGCM